MEPTRRNRLPRQVRRQLDFDNTPPIGSPTELTPEPAKKHRRWGLWILIGLGALIGLLLVAMLVFYFYIKAVPLSGETTGRINILVLGVDTIPPPRSDTMMIMSIDTAAHPAKLALISIPRDMYVEIPGYYSTRINAAYTLGEQAKRGSGPALAEATLKQNLGVPIDYYAALNFNGFKDMVEAVGGVDVNVKETLDDPSYPNADYSGTIHFHLSAGHHHLDGKTALEYVRCRKGTCGNDFGRAERQQEVLLAVKDKAISMARHNPFILIKFWHIFQDNVSTDLTPRQLLKIGLLIRKTPASDITQHVIDESNFLVGQFIGGADVLVPKSGNYNATAHYIDNIFKSSKSDLP